MCVMACADYASLGTAEKFVRFPRCGLASLYEQYREANPQTHYESSLLMSCCVSSAAHALKGPVP